MIVISQDKCEIINFDNVFRLYVEDWSNREIENNCFCIKAEVPSDNMMWTVLGEYETEERAKEVLQEIINAYLNCNEDNIFEKYAYVKNEVFEMPKE